MLINWLIDRADLALSVYTITSDKCTLHSTLEKYNVQKYANNLKLNYNLLVWKDKYGV